MPETLVVQVLQHYQAVVGPLQQKLGFAQVGQQIRDLTLFLLDLIPASHDAPLLLREPLRKDVLLLLQRGKLRVELIRESIVALGFALNDVDGVILQESQAFVFPALAEGIYVTLDLQGPEGFAELLQHGCPGSRVELVAVLVRDDHVPRPARDKNVSSRRRGDAELRAPNSHHGALGVNHQVLSPRELCHPQGDGAAHQAEEALLARAGVVQLEGELSAR
ncbi:MAG: hypothetical protein ABSG85_07455 [Spirochaetia bacterium]